MSGMTDLEWQAWLATDAGKDAMIRLLWDLVTAPTVIDVRD